MRVYFRRGSVEYSLSPLSSKDFDAAFCGEHEGVKTIKALTGFPSFFDIENPNRVWPLPPRDLEIFCEEDNTP